MYEEISENCYECLGVSGIFKNLSYFSNRLDICRIA